MKINNKFIVIGRSNCKFCVLAEDFLLASSAEFQFLDYVDAPEILEDYKEFHNQNTVPIILENNLETGKVRKIGGYTDLLDLFK